MSDAQPTSRRMQKLRQVLEKVLVESVDSFSFADMHECYPELAKENGNLLSRFCTDLLQGIRYNVVVRDVFCHAGLFSVLRLTVIFSTNFGSLNSKPSRKKTNWTHSCKSWSSYKTHALSH